MSVHVYAPPTTTCEIKRIDCPVCEKRTYFIVRTFEWFGPEYICLNCGDRWNEDGRRPRPFARNWKEKRLREAKRNYRNAHRTESVK